MFVCPRAQAQAHTCIRIGFECTTEDEYTGQVSLLLVLMRWKCQLCIKVQETQALLSVVIKNLTVVSQAKDFQSISFDAWIFIAEIKRELNHTRFCVWRRICSISIESSFKRPFNLILQMWSNLRLWQLWNGKKEKKLIKIVLWFTNDWRYN